MQMEEGQRMRTDKRMSWRWVLVLAVVMLGLAMLACNGEQVVTNYLFN